MGARSTPPRAALWLLKWLPADCRDHVTGDLTEDHHRRIDQSTRLGAWLWFWRETIAAMWSLGALRRAVPAPMGRDGVWISVRDDLQLAVRVLRRAPAFVVLSSGTLAIGIGATTAIFSIVNPLIIQSLPYPHAAQLMTVWERGVDGSPSNVGYSSFADIAYQARSLESVTAIGMWQPVIGKTDPERVTGERVSAAYFAALGVQPALGRGFTTSEDRPGHNQVVVLSNALWKRRFGADPAVIGRAVTVNAAPVTVVGVMPATFDDVITPGTELWRPLGYDVTLAMACRTCRHLEVIARLRSHVTEERALAELNIISARMVADHPRDYPAPGMLIVPLEHAVMQAYRPVLVAIAGAVVLILLIAIANVANLQLARSVRRRTEFAVRAALGARQIDLLRQLLAEGALLSTLGGVGGLVVAWATLPALVSQLPRGMPRVTSIQIDRAALAVMLVTVLTAGIVVGLAPVTRRGAANAYDRLRYGSGAGDHKYRATRLGLVIGEFGLTLMLLVGAGLVGHSLVRLLAIDVGFDPGHVLSLKLSGVGSTYDQDDAVYAYHDRVLAAVRAVPGVVGAALTSQIPLAGNVDRYGVEAEDRPLANPELSPDADRYVISPGFPETMHIPLLRGRTFAPADFADSAARVVLVGRMLAAQLWPGDDALGKHIRVGGPTAPWRTVVGITGDIRHLALDVQGTGQFYVPERQWPWAEGGVTLVVRTAGAPAAVAPTVRRVVSSVDPTQPISRVETMEHILSASAAQRRMAMILFSTFAAIALLLAAGGIYGILAGSVAERTREIGVRSALGAAPDRIVRLVVGQGVRLAAVGTAVGLVGAFAMMRFLRALLFEITPVDPLTVACVGIVLGAVTFAACLLPAIRAVRIDPISALRGE